MKNKLKTNKGLPREAKRSGGFTLVELLIAMSLFLVVVTISIGALLTIFDANKKAQSSKTVVDNLNLAVENIAGTVRFGKNYHCGNNGNLSNPQNCADNINGDTFLAVTFYDENLARDVIVAYKLNGTAIEMSYNGEPPTPITSTDTNIQLLRFRVFGTNSSDNYQPYVIAVIKGYVGNKPTIQTNFSIETMMSQRTIDI